jgi:hypothetical protein
MANLMTAAQTAAEAVWIAAQAARVAAQAAVRLNPTPETRETFKAACDACTAAWNAREAVTPRRKGRGGFASRAGQRQAAERRAMARR